MPETRQSVARKISALEKGQVVPLHSDPSGRKTQVIGVSGPPGVGKSVIVGKLAKHLSMAGSPVAVLAIDPSSPLTGGAVLGDRVRMPLSFEGADVFIRSVASRGALGGLSEVVPSAIILLESAGYRKIIVETVGVGQSETDIANTADTIVLVQSPGTGDDTQGLKAGVLEIADIYVVNKMDHPEAERTCRTMTEIADASGQSGWTPPVVSAVATENKGIEELADRITAHADFVSGSDLNGLKRRKRTESILAWRAASAFRNRFPFGDLARQVDADRLSVSDALAQVDAAVASVVKNTHHCSRAGG